MLIPRALANQVEQSCYVVVYVILTEILESGYVRSLIPGYTSHSLILLMSLFGKCERTIPYQEKTPNSTQQSTSFEVHNSSRDKSPFWDQPRTAIQDLHQEFLLVVQML